MFSVLLKNRKGYQMCDYSAKSVKQRAAAKDDLLVSHSISSHTRGFVGVLDPSTAVCLLPGTELSFDKPVKIEPKGILSLVTNASRLPYTMARFRQIDTDNMQAHHDALEFPDGAIVKLTELIPGQTARVLQLPADPKMLEGQARKLAEAQQTRAAYV